MSLRAQGTFQTNPYLHIQLPLLGGCCPSSLPFHNKPWICLSPTACCAMGMERVTELLLEPQHPQTAFPVKYFAQLRPCQCFFAVSQCLRPNNLPGRNACATRTSFQTCCCKPFASHPSSHRTSTVTAGRNVPLRNTTSHP